MIRGVLVRHNHRSPTRTLQVPDLRMSHEVLEYGSVRTGQAGVVTLQLHNHKQVPCDWCVKLPIEASKAKDWAFFAVEPPEGVLEPDQRLNVRVIFTPVLGREAPYQQVLRRAGDGEWLLGWLTLSAWVMGS